MPAWSKLDSRFHCNAKVTYLASRNDPICAVVRMISWSNEANSGGRIPKHVAEGFATEKCIARLMETAPMAKSPFLHKVDGGYEIHDFHEYCLAADGSRAGANPELSAKRAEAGRRGGARAAERRRADQQDGSNLLPANQANEQQLATSKVANSDSNLLTRVRERAPARSHSLSLSKSSPEDPEREDVTAAREDVLDVLLGGADIFPDVSEEILEQVAGRLAQAVLDEPTAARDGLEPSVVALEAIVATREWVERYPLSTGAARVARVESHAVRFVLGDCRAGKRRKVAPSGPQVAQFRAVRNGFNPE